MTDSVVKISKATAKEDLDALDAGVDLVFPINWGDALRAAPGQAQYSALAAKAKEAGYNFTDHQVGFGI